MKVIAAYLLAVLSGNKSPTSNDLNEILLSVGAETDESRIEMLLSEVKGKDISEIIASGREKLASVPSAAAIAVQAPAGGAASAPAEESKKEKKKEEDEGSEDGDIGFGLFDE